MSKPTEKVAKRSGATENYLRAREGVEQKQTEIRGLGVRFKRAQEELESTEGGYREAARGAVLSGSKGQATALADSVREGQIACDGLEESLRVAVEQLKVAQAELEAATGPCVDEQCALAVDEGEAVARALTAHCNGASTQCEKWRSILNRLRSLGHPKSAGLAVDLEQWFALFQGNRFAESVAPLDADEVVAGLRDYTS